jgi:ribosome biogenesis protein Tsr3
MKDTTLKEEHQKMMSKLDNQIEHRVITKELAANPTNRGANAGQFGGEEAEAITSVFTKTETKKVNILEGMH